jgi:DNA-binding CsgD family transcriptional regulator
MNSDVCQLRAEEERLSSFTRRLIEIAAIAGARGTGTSTINVLNSMHLPAIALDRRGYVVHVNAAADAVFDDDVKMKNHKHFFVCDPEARALLKSSLDKLTNPVKSKSLIAEPIIVQRRNKLPVILRIWPYDGPTHAPEQQVRALVTLNALGQNPSPPATILAKTFHLTPPEAKLACVIARGAPLQIAARELEIPWETARTQLKSVFAKTCTHRQSELVALLLQVE